MNKVVYQIPNISCGHCVNTIEMELSDLQGVVSVKADADTKTAVIEFQEPVSEDQLKDLLREINYPAQEI